MVSVPTGVAEGASVRGRSAALDGLRGLALVAVLAYHAAPSTVAGGFLGVEVFFVLSGYLLAAALLDEHRRTGAIAGWRYARRRVRRVAPALAALLAGLVVFWPLVAPDAAHRLAGDVASSLAGVTNWHLIADGTSYFDRVGRPSPVRHLWSVAVEVQFYVLCPFLVAGLARWRRRRLEAAALAAGIGLSALVMAVLHRSGDPSRAYYGTDARVGALLTGVLVAVLLGSRSGPAAARRRPRKDRLGGVGLAVLVVLFLVADDRARLSYPAAFLAAQAATAAVIVAVRRGRSPAGSALGSEPLRWLGLRSFGIYLWHWPLVVLLRPGVDVSWSPAVAGLVIVALAVVLGTLSYGLVERPLLRRRTRWRPPGTRPARPVLGGIGALAAAALVGLYLRIPATDPLAESLTAGMRLLDEQPAPPSPAPAVTDAAPAPPATQAPPVAEAVPPPPPEVTPEPTAAVPAPAAVAPPGGAVSAIGDSVMISAAGALQSRLGPSVFIDARNSRQFAEGVVLARRMREEQRLAPVVIVHLGNNGPVRPADIDALMRELAGVPRVILVNVRVEAPWRDSVNETFANAANRYPAITLVDWNRSSDDHRAWFQADGTHFRTTSGPGANAYADLIVGAVTVTCPAPAPSAPCLTCPAGDPHPRPPRQDGALPHRRRVAAAPSAGPHPRGPVTPAVAG
ncbi:MAG: acyltransferase family protein [Acidimicrobiales bacterium]